MFQCTIPSFPTQLPAVIWRRIPAALRHAWITLGVENGTVPCALASEGIAKHANTVVAIDSTNRVSNSLHRPCPRHLPLRGGARHHPPPPMAGRPRLPRAGIMAEVNLPAIGPGKINADASLTSSASRGTSLKAPPLPRQSSGCQRRILKLVPGRASSQKAKAQDAPTAERLKTAPGNEPSVSEVKCRGRESNPHAPCGTQDFKSCASASSATPACRSVRGTCRFYSGGRILRQQTPGPSILQELPTRDIADEPRARDGKGGSHASCPRLPEREPCVDRRQ